MRAFFDRIIAAVLGYADPYAAALVPYQVPAVGHHGTVDVTCCINGNTFRIRSADQRCHLTGLEAAGSDTDFPTPVIILRAIRLRVRNIDQSVRAKMDTAWSTELRPLLDKVTVEIEHL